MEIKKKEKIDRIAGDLLIGLFELAGMESDGETRAYLRELLNIIGETSLDLRFMLGRRTTSSVAELKAQCAPEYDPHKCYRLMHDTLDR